MALHRDSGPSSEEMRATSDSLNDIGRSLRFSRQQAELSLDDVSQLTGLDRADIEALEGGAVDRLRDRVETLRFLRTYADFLGLPGNNYVLAAVDLWPRLEPGAARSLDSAPVPIVSVSTTPLTDQAHSVGGGWTLDRTGVTEFAVTGIFSPLNTSPTGMVQSEPEGDTGQLPRVKGSAPRSLKALVGLTALLVVIGLFSLLAHQHFGAWHKDLQADASHWFNDFKVDTDITPRPAKHAAGTTVVADKPPKVVISQSPSTSAVTMKVYAKSFSVKMVAFKSPSWMQVTDSAQVAPLFQQVVPGGGNDTFPVTGTLTVETGSAAARAYVYEGTTFIGYYFPTKAPFTMTFEAVG
ncbi:MAG TPA: helix-turn-helix transcriptional regulator [Acidimicrobiales bacterium]